MTDSEASAPVRKAAGRGARVWDLPVRLFHWLLVAAVATSIATGMTGGLWQMDVHVVSGIFILGLVLFRTFWGLAGGRHARFVNFLKGPGTVFAYARDLFARREGHTPGHNPLGGWSVVVLLLLLGAQAATGLFSNDDIFVKGPLADLAGKELSDTLTGWHHRLSVLIWVVVGLHVAAVAVHWWRGDNLVTPMITGMKPGLDPAEGDDRRRPAAFLVVAALAAAAVWGILSLG